MFQMGNKKIYVSNVVVPINPYLYCNKQKCFGKLNGRLFKKHKQ